MTPLIDKDSRGLPNIVVLLNYFIGTRTLIPIVPRLMLRMSYVQYYQYNSAFYYNTNYLSTKACGLKLHLTF